MIKRLFFDRVHSFAGNRTVNKRIKIPAPVFPDPAKPPFSRGDFAAVGAESALYFVSFEFLVEHGFANHNNPHRVIVFLGNNVAVRDFIQSSIEKCVNSVICSNKDF
jgi:hypothetical protein